MGFFDDADVDVNDIPSDPFGFGNEFWPVRIIELGDPAVTKNGDKYGMMVKWIVDHPKYAESRVGKFGLGNGNWMQLPVPRVLQEQGVPWFPKTDEKHAEALFNLGELYKALGFPKDQWSKIGAAELIGKGCLTKISPRQDEMGFWKFNLYQQKPFGEEGGAKGQTGAAAPANSTEGMTPEQMLEAEMRGA